MELETCFEKMKQSVMIRLTQEISGLACIFTSVKKVWVCVARTQVEQDLCSKAG